MKKITVFLVALICMTVMAGGQFVVADSDVQANTNANGQVIINEVKLGGSSNNSIPIEYITLFNSSSNTISLNGWKLEYAKSSNTVNCSSSNWNVSTSQITELSGTLGPDQLSSAITRSFTDNSAGAIHLVDNNGDVQDLVGWGTTSPCSETTPAQTPANDKSIQRYIDCASSFPVDTGDNSSDFTASITPNPTGLSGQYKTTCSAPGSTGTTTTCEGVIINEILPNPGGSDTGNEFVELYNPTGVAIPLDGCSLQTSYSSTKYNFAGVTLQPAQYKAFYDSQTGLTLPNSAGGTVWLLSPTNELQAISYPENVADDVAWARFDDSWQATYAVTPNAANVLQSTEPCPSGQFRDTTTNRCKSVSSSTSTLVPCNPNQVRNPETNRCRNIVKGTNLQACKTGQYRNPATNRCKSTSTTSGTSLKPCKAGQVRNPATNRCKSASASSSSLKPCQTGWQRNPLTHRCRKATAAALANVHDVKSDVKASDRTKWYIAIGAIFAALAYAIYEWRQEILFAYADVKAKIPVINKKK